MSVTRRLALTAALCLAALPAGADPISARASVQTEEFTLSRGATGSYFDTNQDTAALFTDPSSNQSFAIDDTIFFGILGAESRTRASSSSITISFDLARNPEIPVYFQLPEPGVALLIAAGAGLLALRRRRA